MSDELATWRTTPIKTTADIDKTLQHFSQGEEKTAVDLIKAIRDKQLLVYLAGHLQPVLMVLQEVPTNANAIVIVNCVVQDLANVQPAISSGLFKTLKVMFERWPADAPKETVNHVSVTAKCSVAEHSEMQLCEAGLHLWLMKEVQQDGATAGLALQALGNIAFALACKPILLEAGAVQLASALLKSKKPSDPVYGKLFNFLRSMSLHPPALTLMLGYGIIDAVGAKLLPETLNGPLPKPDKDVFWFISNLSDSEAGTKAMLDAGFLPVILRFLGDKQPKAEGTQEYHENIIKALYRMAKVKSVHETLLDMGVVDLLTAESKRSPNTALMGIALLVGKQDEGKYAGIITADKKILDSIIHNMKATVQNHLSGQAAFVKQPLSVVDYFEAIQAISIADANKIQLCHPQTLDTLVDVIAKCSKDLPIVAAGMNVLLELTFAQPAIAYFTTNKETVFKRLDDACAPHNGDVNLAKTLADFKFRLEPEEKKKEQSAQRRKSLVGLPGTPAPDKTVFFSYNWAHQAAVIKLANGVKAAGYKVWLDIEQMTGSTVEAMADGLDAASLVVVDISPQYKESANCRLEGMYAMQRRLPLIPVMFEERYSPTGWLGLLLGTRLWYKHTSEGMYDQTLASILREINTKIGPPGPQTGNNALTTASPPPPPAAPKSSMANMSVKEVGEWAQKVGLGMYAPQLADGGIDGAALQWLVRQDDRGVEAAALVQKLGIQVPGHAYRMLEMARALR